MLLFKLAVKEVWNQKRLSFFFVFNLALGLAGFLSLNAFRTSTEAAFRARSKNILTADIEIGARRALTPQELADAAAGLPEGTQSHATIASYSMVRTDSEARLVQLQAIAPDYPFYGDLPLREQGRQRRVADTDLLTGANAWVDPDLLVQLNLKIGDRIQLGEASATVTDVLEADASLSFSVGMAPRVFVSHATLDASRLIRPGSTSYQMHLYRLPEGADAEALARKLNQRLTDPGIRVTPYTKASEQVGALLKYLTDYLGIAALIALFLSAVGAAFLYRTFLLRGAKAVAILRSLGARRRQIVFIYLTQLLLLGMAATGFALLFGVLVLPFLKLALKTFLPSDFSMAIAAQDILVLFVVGLLTSLVVGLPLLARLTAIRPLSILTGESLRDARPTARSLLLLMPGFLLLFSLAVWQSHSLKVGSLFYGVFLGAGAIAGFLAWLGLQGLTPFTSRGSLSWRLPLRQLVRQPLASLSAFLALSLGVLLLNLLPQIKTLLKSELERPEEGVVPSLFLFDIQEEQLEDLKTLVLKNGVVFQPASPLVRARIDKVNGEPFSKSRNQGTALTREEEESERFRNRGFNLSYRDRLSDSETLVAGREFSGRFDPGQSEVAEISMEKRFADRMGFRLGDTLELDVQGIPVQGKIINLRTVRWTSFQPNFFVLLQPGVLEEAPKTFIAALPSLPTNKKLDLQRQITQTFTNVSAIDVTSLVAKILSIVEQMSWALELMAALALLSGLAVLYSIADQQIQTRRRDFNLIKILGATPALNRRLLHTEFLILSATASFVGASLSVMMSFALARVIFTGIWVVDLVTPAMTVAATLLMTALIVELAARRVLQEKPLALLTA